jgi:hypothetical protein
VARILVDVVHELDLLASLRQVILVYTDLVGPEAPWLIRLSKPSQSIVEAGGEPKVLAVADDLVAAVRFAPHVRDWLVLFRRGDVEELKLALQWIASHSRIQGQHSNGLVVGQRVILILQRFCGSLVRR